MDIQYNAPWSVHPPMNMMEPLSELAGDGFEPQTRARSNTWPLPRPENYVDPPDESNKCAALPVGLAGMEGGGGGGGAAGVGVSSAGGGGGGLPMPTSVITASKKNSSRRNAWGNLSYADLITQAITSAPEKRLTLSQIYEWMVQNVPYFKDKGDSNSSAGWKNSIRHNLSLHNRFMRVQNEGTGKSSWWMINPDAKPGKSVRRRAASMETSKFEKRRGRVKKKVEALRNGSLTASGNVGVGPDATPSPSSSVSEGLDLFPDSPLHSATGFQLSPDFRPRASSATSSCGRLSPIPAVVGVEPDWSSPSPYTATPAAYSPEQMGTNTGSGGLNTGSYSPDQLAGNLEQGMKLQADAYLHGYVNGGQAPQQQAPPPPYPTAYEPAFSATGGARRDLSGLATYGLSSHCPLHRLQPCACMQQQSMSPSPGMSPSYTQSEPSPDPMSNQFLIQNCTANGHTPRPPSSSPPLTPTSNHTSVMGHTASTMMGQLMGALNNSTLLDDLNLNIETLHGGFDCNVDEVIKHELSMEGSLDFNFTAGATQHHAHHHQHPHHQTQDVSATMSTQPPAATPSGAYSTNVTAPSWVH